MTAIAWEKLLEILRDKFRLSRQIPISQTSMHVLTVFWVHFQITRITHHTVWFVLLFIEQWKTWFSIRIVFQSSYIQFTIQYFWDDPALSPTHLQTEVKLHRDPLWILHIQLSMMSWCIILPSFHSGQALQALICAWYHDTMWFTHCCFPNHHGVAWHLTA